MPKEKNEYHEGESEESTISETDKNIKKGMDRYQSKMKLGEEETPSSPAGDSTRSEE
jgi:hypothetical protein